MQRAAASVLPVTPQQHLQPQVQVDRPIKRQKTIDTSSATAKPASESLSVQVAPDAEKEKRDRAIEKLAEQVGETKWVLNTIDRESGDATGALRVLQAGYSEIDHEARRPNNIGRRSFGKFNREPEVGQSSSSTCHCNFAALCSSWS